MVNMRESEHDTTFETSLLTVDQRINLSIVLVRAQSSSEYPNMVRGKISSVQIIGRYVYKAPPPLA